MSTIQEVKVMSARAVLEQKVRFTYLREEAGLFVHAATKQLTTLMAPVACIATVVDEEKGEATFAVTECSRKDTFNKQFGRIVTFERILKHRANHTFTIKSGPGLHRAIVQMIANTPKFTKRTHEAAKMWLANHTPLPTYGAPPAQKGPATNGIPCS